MRSLNFHELDHRTRYHYLVGSVMPRPIAWASTISNNGHVNLAPYSFFNVFGANPPLLIFSSNRRGRDNTTKDTYHNIQETNEVVINLVPYRLVNQMSITSTEFDEEVNEFEKAGLTALPSMQVAPPRVKESPIQFECKVIDILPTGNQGGAANLFLCHVEMMHIDESILDADDQIDHQQLKIVGRMGKSYYAKAFDDSVFEINKSSAVDNLGFDELPNHIKSSKYLTGNEIAQFAMQSAFPTDEEMNEIATSYAQMSPVEKHNTVKAWLKQGNVREAFALLMKQST